MVTRLQRHLTARDLDDLPHEWDTLYELIGGVLHLSRRPSRRHQRIIATIVMEIGPAVRAAGGDVLPEPGVVWEEDGEDNVSPDVAVVLSAERNQGAKLSVCPEIVIEVLSPGEENRERDLGAKRELYWRRGAKEYWVLDPEERCLIRLVRGDAGWIEQRVPESGRVTTPLLPGWPGASISALLA